MAYRAILTVEGSNVSEYRLGSIVFNVKQDVDEVGRPSTEAKSGLLRFMLATDNVDTDFFVNWMVDPNAKKNGTVIYRNVSDGSTVQRLEFRNAVCVDYFEMFNVEFDQRSHMDGKLSPNMNIKFLGGRFPVTSPGQGLVTYLSFYAEEVQLGSITLRN
jgi:Hemolysin coregulated protein Hcp (TssD)